MSSGTGTVDDPWLLSTPSGGSSYTLWLDDSTDPPLLTCLVGKTTLTYLGSALDDLHAMLVANGDWVPLGAADEQKPAMEGTVEAWARSATNPVGGWYGQKKGMRGRFGVYLPPALVHQGRAEIAIENRKARIRAL
jgi:hypothetical protein